MLPLSDGIPARRFPVVGVAIAASGFLFGVVAARLLIASGRARGRSDPAGLRGLALRMKASAA